MMQSSTLDLGMMRRGPNGAPTTNTPATTLGQCVRQKDNDRNLISATFHALTISAISMSMVDLSWFNIYGGYGHYGVVPYLTLGEFFWFGYGADGFTDDFDFVDTTIVNMMRITILLCFMAILFSLFGFLLDIIGPKSLLYRMIRRYAVPGTFTLLWIMAIVCISYYVIILLEDSVNRLNPKTEVTVSYGPGFYCLTAAGTVCLFGIFYNLLMVQPPIPYYHRGGTDRCLIENFDDSLDTFNNPSPPPPYSVPPPPPPYTLPPPPYTP